MNNRNPDTRPGHRRTPSQASDKHSAHRHQHPRRQNAARKSHARMLSADGRAGSPATGPAGLRLESAASVSERQLQDLGLSPTVKSHQVRLTESEYHEMVGKYSHAANSQRPPAAAAGGVDAVDIDADIIMDDADFNIFSYAETKSMQMDLNEDIIIPRVYGCPETPIEGAFSTQAANPPPIANYAYSFEEAGGVTCRKGSASRKAAAWPKAGEHPAERSGAGAAGAASTTGAGSHHKVTKEEVVQSLRLNVNRSQAEPRFVPSLKTNDFSSVFDGPNKRPNGA